MLILFLLVSEKVISITPILEKKMQVPNIELKEPKICFAFLSGGEYKTPIDGPYSASALGSSCFTSSHLLEDT
jgi:hypothetical protein